MVPTTTSGAAAAQTCRTLTVPVATYTPWNMRGPSIGAEGELLGLQGGYIPFAKTKAERESTGDPRPALLEKYRDFADYQQQLMAAAGEATRRSLICWPEDLPSHQSRRAKSIVHCLNHTKTLTANAADPRSIVPSVRSHICNHRPYSAFRQLRVCLVELDTPYNLKLPSPQIPTVRKSTHARSSRFPPST